MKKSIILSISLLLSVGSTRPVGQTCELLLEGVAEVAFQAGREDQFIKSQEDAILGHLLEHPEELVGLLVHDIMVKNPKTHQTVHVKALTSEEANKLAGDRWKQVGKTCGQLSSENGHPDKVCSDVCTNFGGWAGFAYTSSANANLSESGVALLKASQKTLAEVATADPSNVREGAPQGLPNRCFLDTVETMGDQRDTKLNGYCLCNSAVKVEVVATSEHPAPAATQAVSGTLQQSTGGPAVTQVRSE